MTLLTEPTRIVLAKTSVAAGLLDAYAGAAAAYSLRRLSANYTGPVVRVRRSSDSTEQDFTATQVTDGTLTTFCGAGDGFVQTWYDQSGNGLDMQQATTAQQPQLVTSGVLSVEAGAGGKPAMLFNGSTSSRFLSATINSITKTNISAFAVARVANYTSAYPNSGSIISQATATGAWLIDVASSAASQGRGGSASNASIAVSNAGPYLVHASQNRTAAELNVNGLTQATTNSALTNYNTNQSFILGRLSSTENRLNGSISEVIFYSPNVTVNQIAIRANINAHYAIY